MIRLAIDGDFTQVFNIILASKVNKFLLVPANASDSEKLRWWSKYGKSCLIFEDNGEILGFLSFIDMGGRKRHIVEMVSIGVLPEYLGKGIAKALINELITKFKGKKVKLESSVRSDNERALGLYLKLGFEIEGERKKNILQKGQFFDSKFIAYWF